MTKRDYFRMSLYTVFKKIPAQYTFNELKGFSDGVVKGNIVTCVFDVQ